MQATKKNLRKFSLLVCIIVASAVEPVHGQFIRTYFKLTPGIQVVPTGTQLPIKSTLAGVAEVTPKAFFELRAIENLEIMIEVFSSDDNSYGLPTSIQLYGNYPTKTLTPHRDATFVLKKNDPTKFGDDTKAQPFRAMLGLPQETKGLIIIHYP